MRKLPIVLMVTMSSVTSGGEERIEAPKIQPDSAELRLSDWHAYATRYIFAPTFRCEPVKGTAEYRIRLRPSSGPEQTLASKTPVVSLEKVWERIPFGQVTGTLAAVDSSEAVLATKTITFHKARDFDGVVAPYRHSIPDLVDGVAGFLVNTRSPKAFEPNRSPLLWHATIKTDGTVSPMGYPTHNAYHIEFFLDYAKWTRKADLARQGIMLARDLADWNVQHRTPADWKYPGIFYTTVVQGKMGGEVDGDTLIVTLTALLGRSLLRLGIAENEPKYAQAALGTAQCLLSTQYPEGNWPFRVEPKTGKVGNPYTSSIILPVLFFDEMIDAPATLLPGVNVEDLRQRLRASRTRAMAWIIANPLQDYRWEGFCEDISNLPPYVATEWYDAGWTAKYLIEHRGEFPKQQEAALRLISWIEDQFVCWHAADVPRLKSRIPIVPLVLEQYRCYSAVDACNAWLLDIYRVAHQASGNDLYLRKAKALASALTRARRPSGAIATWSWFETAEDAGDEKPADLGDWFSCMAYDAHVLMRHEKALK